jgi:hypothetical protein
LLFFFQATLPNWTWAPIQIPNITCNLQQGAFLH